MYRSITRVYSHFLLIELLFSDVPVACRRGFLYLQNVCFDGACSDDEEDQAWVFQKVDNAIHRKNR